MTFSVSSLIVRGIDLVAPRQTSYHSYEGSQLLALFFRWAFSSPHQNELFPKLIRMGGTYFICEKISSTLINPKTSFLYRKMRLQIKKHFFPLHQLIEKRLEYENLIKDYLINRLTPKAVSYQKDQQNKAIQKKIRDFVEYLLSFIKCLPIWILLYFKSATMHRIGHLASGILFNDPFHLRDRLKDQFYKFVFPLFLDVQKEIWSFVKKVA